MERSHFTTKMESYQVLLYCIPELKSNILYNYLLRKYAIFTQLNLRQFIYVELYLRPELKTHLYNNNTTEDEKETTSLRDLEVSVAKLYAIVNTQAAANREKDTINQN